MLVPTEIASLLVWQKACLSVEGFFSRLTTDVTYFVSLAFFGKENFLTAMSAYLSVSKSVYTFRTPRPPPPPLPPRLLSLFHTHTQTHTHTRARARPPARTIFKFKDPLLLLEKRPSTRPCHHRLLRDNICNCRPPPPPLLSLSLSLGGGGGEGAACMTLSLSLSLTSNSLSLSTHTHTHARAHTHPTTTTTTTCSQTHANTDIHTYI